MLSFASVLGREGSTSTNGGVTCRFWLLGKEKGVWKEVQWNRLESEEEDMGDIQTEKRERSFGVKRVRKNLHQ